MLREGWQSNMSLPDYQALMLPLLKRAALGDTPKNKWVKNLDSPRKGAPSFSRAGSKGYIGIQAGALFPPSPVNKNYDPFHADLA
jgi:hypothetical protein